MDRSAQMIQVAYYFGRYDATRGKRGPAVPPEMRALGLLKRTHALKLLHQELGAGRTEKTFLNSIKGDITYVRDSLSANQPLGDDRIKSIGSLYGAPDDVLWRAIRSFLPESFNSNKAAPKDRESGSPAEEKIKTARNPPRTPPAATYYSPDEVEAASPAIEGATKTITVNAFERSSANRELCIKRHLPVCAACEMDFKSRYGEFAAGFIHVHHLNPLSEVRQAHMVDPEKDLCPVCPNCHAVIHMRRPPYTIEEVKEMLRMNNPSAGIP